MQHAIYRGDNYKNWVTKYWYTVIEIIQIVDDMYKIYILSEKNYDWM